MGTWTTTEHNPSIRIIFHTTIIIGLGLSFICILPIPNALLVTMYPTCFTFATLVILRCAYPVIPYISISIPRLLFSYNLADDRIALEAVDFETL